MPNHHRIIRRVLSTQRSTSWERNAVLVKNTDINNQYLEHIRDTHDPALHIKTLEDEIRGSMGKALGKQGEKVLYYIELMKNEREQHLKTPNDVECARRHNEYRKQALQARWELMVHRQAVGFIINNQKFVNKHFPIDDAIPMDGNISTTNQDQKLNKDDVAGSKKAILRDQLDWWERVGRWR